MNWASRQTISLPVVFVDEGQTDVHGEPWVTRKPQIAGVRRSTVRSSEAAMGRTLKETCQRLWRPVVWKVRYEALRL
jgi:hypothetical protein